MKTNPSIRFNFMRSALALLLVPFVAATVASAETLEKKPADPYFEKFAPVKAPEPKKHFLKEGDRLAICGDSITEQRMYSRIMETYLTVCAPELNISVRQYGWGGERAPGFLARMTNDCLRFEPTVATTCYGMNDHEYRAYEQRIGDKYRESSTAIDEAFKAHGVRVIEGSAGCVGKAPGWVGDKKATVDDLNMNLCQLRNIGVGIAGHEKIGFADVFWPMLTAAHEAQLKYGTNYTICGKDGVHPGWAGHVVMAYAFLHELGLDGDIGTFTVDLRTQKAEVSAGHRLLGFNNGQLSVESKRYPFCIGDGDLAKDDNIHSGTQWVPFNRELNRLMLVVKHPEARTYNVTWGDQTKTYSAKELMEGINLAADFLHNPFDEAFKKVDQAVAAKQAYETKEIKELFRSAAAKTDMEGVATKAESERSALAGAIKEAFVPVTHAIRITAQ